MHRFLSILFACLLSQLMVAQQITCDFHQTSLSEALKYVQSQSPSHNILFIYDDLENYRITASFRDVDTEEAIRQLVGDLPIRISCDESDIFLERQNSGQSFATRNPISIVEGPVRTIILERVFVDGEVPAIQLLTDGLLANVAGSELSSLGSVYEVLDHLPGISREGDDVIIAGQGKPVFYLNGRKLRDSNDLHELNAADIRSIRIDYRPHARHEASAIHITTRHTRQDGLSLSAQTACGQSENTDITTQLHASYHLNQLDLFTHLSASFQNEDSYTCMEQDIREDTITHLSLQSHLSDRHQTVRSVLGFSYSHDSVNSSGMRLALNVDLPSDGQESYEGSAHFLQPWDTPLRETKNSLHTPRNSSFFYNVYCIRQLGNVQCEANIDWLRDAKQKDRVNLWRELDYNQVNNELLAFSLQGKGRLWGGSMEMGGEYSNTNRKNKFHSIALHGIDMSNSTEIRLQNDRFSLFAEYDRSIGSLFHLSTGIRFEYNSFRYCQDGKWMNDMNQSLTSLQPRFAIGYQRDDLRLSVDYNRTLRHPLYAQLSANYDYLTQYYILTGNPFLMPTESDRLSLRGQLKFLTLGAAYCDINNESISWVDSFDSHSCITIQNYVNAEKIHRLSVFLEAIPKIGHFRPVLSAGMDKQWFNVPMSWGIVTLNRPTFFLHASGQYTLFQGLTADFNFRYTSSGDHENFRTNKGRVITHLGLTQSLFGNSLSLRLAAHDLFRTNRDETMYANYIESRIQSHSDSRFIEFTIRYNFNELRNRYKGSGAGKAEKQRL